MISLDDEDDEDFTIRPETSSKLANLFGANESNLDVDSSNDALKYTAPKQPKKFEMANNSSDSPNSPSVMALIHASAVNVFKYENNRYVSQGKLGAALLGNHDNRSYKLILYTGKQQHITYATINDNFKLICQPNNYVSFYDDNRQNWSVMFDTEDEKLNFSRLLTLCKYNSQSNQKERIILTQDLTIGDETHPIVAEENDNIELGYKGWMFEENQTSGKLFVNSTKKPIRLKLVGKWTQMLNGLRIGGKRFAIFGVSLAEELSPIVDNAPFSENCRYGLQLELVKIQSRGTNNKPVIDSKESKVLANNPELNESSKSKSHSNSISDENESKQKTDMISRVTRMGGLAILPIRSDTKPESVDTTDTNEEDSLHSKPLPKPRNNSNASNISQCNETQSQTNSNAIPSTTGSLNSAQMSPNLSSQTIESNLALLTAETRSNQTEIRYNLAKIYDKINSVSEKVQNYSNPQSIGFMDSTILLSSIQRIVTENSTLKKEVEEKTSSLQKLNEKIVDLLHIQSTGGQHSSELNSLRLSEAALRQEISKLNDINQRIKDQSENLRSENIQLKQTIEELKTQIQNRPNLETTSRISKENATQMKRLLNDVFKRINSQIDDNRSYTSEEVIDIVSNCMRSATIAALDSKNSSRTNSPLRQSVDEIDIKDNLSSNQSNTDLIAREVEKPPIPQRKSIDCNTKNTNQVENSGESVGHSIN